ncbi:MAG: long-chain fatty acid--CoA ligase [Sphingobacteriales bacterium]|nr:MAG: long-chain fatty acid--CoA ligase [Sphingobacteriales bacterium]
MNQPQRLFDCIPLQAAAPLPDLLAAKVGDRYLPMATHEVHDTIQRLAAGLLQKGISFGDGTVEGRDKIAILSNSRPEWLIVDLAVQLSGAVLVPLYPNIATAEWVSIFQEAEVKGCFVSSRALYEQMMDQKASLPKLEWVVCFEMASALPHWEILLAKTVAPETAQRLAAIQAQLTAEDVATIIYTSGTTGQPKGVMLSHGNIVSNVMAATPILMGIPLPERKALSFLPLNHIFEKMISYVYLFNGFSIYYAESMETIGANLKEVQPSLFVTVPRLLEKVYERIMTTGSALTGIKKQLFFWAVNLGKTYDYTQPQSWWYRTQLKLANKLIFSKWREALGGRVGAIVVGGAACQPRLERIFSSAGIVVMQGYGLTETSPVIAVNHYDAANRRIGTVGPVISGVEVKLAEDGEILCKGPNVMKGYYKNEAATQEAIPDSWFHTGDIGAFVDGTFLKITDRKKELFKTSGGKYVAPQPIENKLKESRFIEQAMVVGEDEKFVAALIVPSFDNLQSWMAEKGLTFSGKEAAVALPVVQAYFEEIIAGFNSGFNHVEQVKKFILVADDWSVEGGQMTPKLSLRRKIIKEHYRPRLETLYRPAQPNP